MKKKSKKGIDLYTPLIINLFFPIFTELTAYINQRLNNKLLILLYFFLIKN